ncbi:hypothetical protein BC829DRAFT_36447 [Chytridium lagenaria]|nr:hypothetical protein BC829DRAFT_36447 [Chytridium lagenaria]
MYEVQGLHEVSGMDDNDSPSFSGKHADVLGNLFLVAEGVDNSKYASPTKSGRLGKMKTATLRKAVSSPPAFHSQESPNRKPQSNLQAGSSFSSEIQKEIPSPKAKDDKFAGGLAYTYGRTRSFLAEDGVDVENPLETYATFLKRNKYEGLDTSDSEDDASKKELKTTHELREAGELKRFSDEMEYLMSGLQANQAANVRRSSSYGKHPTPLFA